MEGTLRWKLSVIQVLPHNQREVITHGHHTTTITNEINAPADVDENMDENALINE